MRNQRNKCTARSRRLGILEKSLLIILKRWENRDPEFVKNLERIVNEGFSSGKIRSLRDALGYLIKSEISLKQGEPINRYRVQKIVESLNQKGLVDIRNGLRLSDEGHKIAERILLEMEKGEIIKEAIRLLRKQGIRKATMEQIKDALREILQKKKMTMNEDYWSEDKIGRILKKMGIKHKIVRLYDLESAPQS